MAYSRKSRSKIPYVRRNTYIRISPIRLINEKGENVGIVETNKALSMAQDKDLDLVEIAPQAKPPVCKIMSWSKYKYDLSKKRKSGSKGKAKEQKEMRFSPFIDEGDIKHKLKKVKEFLKKKHPVKITIRVKGRVQKEVVTKQLENILAMIENEYETSEHPHFEGRNYAILIFPKKS